MALQKSITMLRNKLISLSRSNKTALMVGTDALGLLFCFIAAMWLRLGNLSLMMEYGYLPYISIPLVTIAIFTLSGLYRAVIRFIDRHLLTRTIISLGAVVVLTYLAAYFLDDKKLPRNALMIYWFVAFAYVLASRLSARSFLRKVSRHKSRDKITVAIYGAGEAGVQLLRAMQSENNYDATCFIDEKQELANRTVAGLRVFDSKNLVDLVDQMEISQVVLAIPSATPKRRGEILQSVRKAGIPVKTLSSLMELTDGNISTHAIREIKIEDLLGRKPVPPMLDLFAKCIHEQNVLVTGAGGSIGSELCRQILSQSPCSLHLLDHSEYALYTIEQDLRSRFPKLSVHAHLGSVCDAHLLNRIISEGQIDTIYHAAAYKHVPLVEANMAEGIRNNVLGAQVLVSAAEKHQVKTCVLISSDKAVRPTNVMGASKRIAELVFQAAGENNSSQTTFSMVRFGNVLGSSGSVVPLFQKQIENGGPITITHPDITRYFMLIPEAAQLVIQAGAMATDGGVFILEMGDPVKIIDLARTMIDLAGLSEKCRDQNGDIEIKFIGLRPGEKLYEELLINGQPTKTEHPRIMRTRETFIPASELNQLIDQLMAACHDNDDDTIKFCLKKIVTDFSANENLIMIKDAESNSKPMPSSTHSRHRHSA